MIFFSKLIVNLVAVKDVFFSKLIVNLVASRRQNWHRSAISVKKRCNNFANDAIWIYICIYIYIYIYMYIYIYKVLLRSVSSQQWMCQIETTNWSPSSGKIATVFPPIYLLRIQKYARPYENEWWYFLYFCQFFRSTVRQYPFCRLYRFVSVCIPSFFPRHRVNASLCSPTGHRVPWSLTNHNLFVNVVNGGERICPTGEHRRTNRSLVIGELPR